MKTPPIMSISTEQFSLIKTGSWRFETPEFQKKISPCNEACPAGNDIEGFMVLVKEGKVHEAWELIKKENPFPGVCGRVCFHPCESSCNRREFDEGLSIQAIERYIADSQFNAKRETSQTKIQRKERIAVIGSGPSGLTCAYHLARIGYGVTVFESHSSPGGILRTGIPEYRLPKSILDREISDIESWGVEIKTNTQIGRDISFEDLKKFEAIFIATGAHQSKRLNIEGEDLEGVLSGLNFLKSINTSEKISIGERVVVIGGGNVAVDVSRSAWRLGSKKIQMVCLESREEMPAFPGEILETEAEGISILPSAMPLRIVTKGSAKRIDFIKAKLGEPKLDGSLNPIPIPGTEFFLEADSVITAIGEVPDLSFILKEVPSQKGLIQVDEMGFARINRYFAGGDATNRTHTVVGAIGSGKRAALAIHEYFQGGWLKEKFRMIQVGEKGTISLEKYFHLPEGGINPSTVSFKEINTAYFEHRPRVSVFKLPVEKRKATFKEINSGLSMEMAEEEVDRCFNCGVCNECGNCYIFCPDLAIMVNPREETFEIDYDHCKGCMICLEECPRGFISLKESGDHQ